MAVVASVVAVVAAAALADLQDGLVPVEVPSAAAVVEVLDVVVAAVAADLYTVPVAGPGLGVVAAISAAQAAPVASFSFSFRY